MFKLDEKCFSPRERVVPNIKPIKMVSSVGRQISRVVTGEGLVLVNVTDTVGCKTEEHHQQN